MSAIETAKAFLSHFPENRRSKVMNWFLFGVREGCSTPEAVVEAVQRRANANRDLGLLEALGKYPEEALLLARYALAWESLPREKKKQIKEAMSRHYREEYMKQKPPTEKQLACLARLGYRGEVRDRLDASRLIALITSLKIGGQQANKNVPPKSP